MFELHDFYKELATKYNLSIDQVEEICRSQFKWLMSNIQSGEFKPIKLIKLGKFVPIERRKLKALNGEYEGSVKRYSGERRENKEEDSNKEINS